MPPTPSGDKIVVSACLLGSACRYDGSARHHAAVATFVHMQRANGVEVIAVCPEELGGLGTPRPAADLRGGDGHAVLTGSARVLVCGAMNERRDVTAAFVLGAEQAALQGHGAGLAILKANSPSCGVGTTHIDGHRLPGDGVFAAMLRRAGVPLRTEDDVLGADRAMTCGEVGAQAPRWHDEPRQEEAE